MLRHEILNRIFGEEFFKFGTELGGQRLVVCENEGWTVDLGNHIRHGKGLSRSGDAEQGLIALLPLEVVEQLRDGLRLVAGGGVRCMKFENSHTHNMPRKKIFSIRKQKK